MSQSLQRMRELSHRYARGGRQNDFDEFRAEMARVERKQRYQILERYINDLYRDYPHIVRNRYHQFVPVRNDRLTVLIRSAIAEQQAANEALRAEKEALEERVDDLKEESAEIAAKNAATQAAAATEESGFEAMWTAYLPQILSLIAVLLTALVIALVYSVITLSSAATQAVAAKDSNTSTMAPKDTDAI